MNIHIQTAYVLHWYLVGLLYYTPHPSIQRFILILFEALQSKVQKLVQP